MRVQTIDHIAVATWSIENALVLFGDLLGGQFVTGGDDPRLGIRTLQLRYPGGAKVELIQPTTPDSYLRSYLKKHGPGFHHMTILLDDVERAIAQLPSRGFEVVDTRLSSPTWRETFVRPRSGFGTLLQLVDSNRDWSEPEPGISLDAVLAGGVVWIDDEPHIRSDSTDERSS